MTYRTLRSRLTAAGVENAAEEAALLWEAFTSYSRASLPFMTETDVTVPALEEALAKREAGYPLQYLLGEWPFWEQTFEVNEHCLIPRSDTECLVQMAVDTLPPGASFVDLCTGSGCVAIATLATRPDTRAVAVDLFPETLALAARNAARNAVADRFFPLLWDVLCVTAPLPPLPKGAPSAPFDALLANPPYIPSGDIESLSREVRQEPRAALDGGDDGLMFYRAIVSARDTWVKPGGILLFEIGYDQGEALRRLAGEHHLSCDIYPDLNGHDRVAKLSDISYTV